MHIFQEPFSNPAGETCCLQNDLWANYRCQSLPGMSTEVTQFGQPLNPLSWNTVAKAVGCGSGTCNCNTKSPTII